MSTTWQSWQLSRMTPFIWATYESLAPKSDRRVTIGIGKESRQLRLKITGSFRLANHSLLVGSCCERSTETNHAAGSYQRPPQGHEGHAKATHRAQGSRVQTASRRTPREDQDGLRDKGRRIHPNLVWNWSDRVRAPKHYRRRRQDHSHGKRLLQRKAV